LIRIGPPPLQRGKCQRVGGVYSKKLQKMLELEVRARGGGKEPKASMEPARERSGQRLLEFSEY